MRLTSANQTIQPLVFYRHDSFESRVRRCLSFCRRRHLCDSAEAVLGAEHRGQVHLPVLMQEVHGVLQLVVDTGGVGEQPDLHKHKPAQNRAQTGLVRHRTTSERASEQTTNSAILPPSDDLDRSGGLGNYSNLGRLVSNDTVSSVKRH